MEILLKNIVLVVIFGAAAILIFENWLWYVVGGADMLARVFNGY